MHTRKEAEKLCKIILIEFNLCCTTAAAVESMAKTTSGAIESLSTNQPNSGSTSRTTRRTTDHQISQLTWELFLKDNMVQQTRRQDKHIISDKILTGIQVQRLATMCCTNRHEVSRHIENGYTQHQNKIQSSQAKKRAIPMAAEHAYG